MTGLSNVRNYVSFGELEKSQTTFGHIFSQSGYATCIAGKWQLGSKDPGLPKHFGFDAHCLWAHMGRGERYANPSLNVNGEFKTFEGKYGPDICQEFVLDFIRRTRSKPFFVYYPMLLTHGGYEATPDSVDWGKPTARSRELGQQHFADMVAYMDKQIGALTRELEALGLISNTLILFTGDNGTGRGAVSEIEGGGEMAGEKGSTTRNGMHVPLIASWPGRIAAGKVCPDLVDMTDFLPTLCDATGVRAPEGLMFDGRSFLPQMCGQKGDPREWIYSYWVPLRSNQTAHVGTRGAIEQAFDHRFKLYSTGEFFNLLTDPDEQSPQRITELQGEASLAARRLQTALEKFKDARPASLAAPRTPREDKKDRKRNGKSESQ
jgi:arylsulfatase A